MSTETATAPEFTTADMRAWASASGLEVGARGRLSAEVVDAFKSAHGLA